MLLDTNIRSFQPLAVMGMVLGGLILAFCIFAAGINTDGLSYDSVEVVDDKGKVVDRILIAPEKELLPPGETPLILRRQEDLFFHYHSQFIVWMFLFSCLLGVSFGFIFPLWYGNRKVSSYLRLNKFQKSLSGVLAIIFLVMAVLLSGGSWSLVLRSEAYYMSFVQISTSFDVLLHSPTMVVMMLISFTSIAPVLALTGMFQVNFGLSQLSDIKDIRLKADRFRLLTESLNFYLFVLTIIISGSTITTAFGREMFLQTFNSQEILFPIEFVYLYGLVFTLFLGLAYLPVYVQLKRKGEWLMYHLLEEEKQLSEAVESKSEPEKKKAQISTSPLPELTGLEDIFLMKSSSMDSLKVILSILAPLLTGVLSKVVDF